MEEKAIKVRQRHRQQRRSHEQHYAEGRGLFLLLILHCLTISTSSSQYVPSLDDAPLRRLEWCISRLEDAGTGAINNNSFAQEQVRRPESVDHAEYTSFLTLMERSSCV